MNSRSVLAIGIFALTFAGAAQAQSNPLSEADRRIVTDALREGLVEEELGRLVQVSSGQPSFVNYGRLLERDPANIRRDLRTIGKRHGVRLPIRPELEDRQAISGLLGLRAGQFDALFKDTVITSREEQLENFRRAATGADSPDVRQLAERAIPVAEAQLEMARSLIPNRSVMSGSPFR
jgi:predicted outer membrane protein